MIVFKFRCDVVRHVQRKRFATKPFGCPLCHKTFRVEGNRQMHVKRMHSVVLTVTEIREMMIKKGEAEGTDQVLQMDLIEFESGFK